MAGFVPPPGTYFIDVNYFYFGRRQEPTPFGAKSARYLSLAHLVFSYFKPRRWTQSEGRKP